MMELIPHNSPHKPGTFANARTLGNASRLRKSAGFLSFSAAMRRVFCYVGAHRFALVLDAEFPKSRAAIAARCVVCEKKIKL